MDLPGRLAVAGERAFHNRIGAVYRAPRLSSRGDTQRQLRRVEAGANEEMGIENGNPIWRFESLGEMTRIRRRKRVLNCKVTLTWTELRRFARVGKVRKKAGAFIAKWLSMTAALFCGLSWRVHAHSQNSSAIATVRIDPMQNLGRWDGWGSSLGWWGRAVGGTANADYYADLIYSTKSVDGYPGLGLNIVRYNVGGGGIAQPAENKGPKLQWQMDIHGHWVDPESEKPTAWDWSVDGNQRSMMLRARARGSNVFELFSDSPMWWMNSNHSAAGSETGGDCLAPT